MWEASTSDRQLHLTKGQSVSIPWFLLYTVCPKKYAHGFVVLCFVVVMQSFIMNSHEVFIHIHQGCFAGTGAIVRLPQCQWSKPDGYGKISQCITTTKHSKAKTVCIFLGIYCNNLFIYQVLCTPIYRRRSIYSFLLRHHVPTAFSSSKYDLCLLYRVLLGPIIITIECIIKHLVDDISLRETNNAPMTSSKWKCVNQ